VSTFTLHISLFFVSGFIFCLKYVIVLSTWPKQYSSDILCNGKVEIYLRLNISNRNENKCNLFHVKSPKLLYIHFVYWDMFAIKNLHTRQKLQMLPPTDNSLSLLQKHLLSLQYLIEFGKDRVIRVLFICFISLLTFAFYLPLVYITFQILEIKKISNIKIKKKPYTAKSKQKPLTNKIKQNPLPLPQAKTN